MAFFVRTLYVFPGILMQNVTPHISYHWKKNEINILNGKLKKVRNINLIVLLFQFLMLLAIYKFVILHITVGFESTYGAFFIATIGTLIFAQISWGGSVLVMTEKLKANFQRTLIVLILNITVCTLFTSSLGFIGSVSAISFNAVLSFLLLRRFVYRQTGLQLI
ncbi:MAG: O-antigen/teichoic acid export membrane protein [Crocinitomix sp.]